MTTHRLPAGWDVKTSWTLPSVFIVLTVLAMAFREAATPTSTAIPTAAPTTTSTPTPTPTAKAMEPQLGDTHTVSATISVGEAPFDIAVTPDGKYVYVTNYEDNAVSIISTAPQKVISPLPQIQKTFSQTLDKLGLTASRTGRYRQWRGIGLKV